MKDSGSHAMVTHCCPGCVPLQIYLEKIRDLDRDHLNIVLMLNEKALVLEAKHHSTAVSIWVSFGLGMAVPILAAVVKKLLG